MVKEGEYVAVFNSIHRVMKAEKLLKGLDLPILLIPAPRAITSDCGLAIRYTDEIRASVEVALAEASLGPEQTYRKQGEVFVRLD